MGRGELGAGHCRGAVLHGDSAVDCGSGKHVCTWERAIPKMAYTDMATGKQQAQGSACLLAPSRDLSISG